MIKETNYDTQWFHYHNENPKNRRTGDCVIRSIALATGKSWEYTLEELTKFAKATYYSPGCPECYNRYLSTLGWNKLNQPKKFDNTKYRGKEFIQLLNSKNYPINTKILVHTGWHHISCLVNSPTFKFWDIWDPSDEVIGNYWVLVE